MEGEQTPSVPVTRHVWRESLADSGFDPLAALDATGLYDDGEAQRITDDVLRHYREEGQ